MGFSYNDITSKSMGLKARLTSWQVSGRLRNFTTTVPGKYGVTDFGADFDYREIVVSCSIFPKHSFSSQPSFRQATHMPIFSMICIINIAAIPVQIKQPNGLSHDSATFIMLYIRKA